MVKQLIEVKWFSFFNVWMLILLIFCVQISRPEDWEKKPDPKKFFVQFYGTNEM